MLKLLLMITFFYLPVSALDFEKEGSSLYMYAGCSEGNKILPALREWSMNSQTHKKCNIRAQSEISQECEFDITNCVPDQVVQYQGARSEIDGPNCWNTALVMSKILPAFRYSTPQEMHFYMQPPLCRPLSEGELPQPGDIGAIRNAKDFENETEVHAFIYISKELAYSKDGFSKEAPYALQPLTKIFKGYGADHQAYRGHNDVNYFRCESMEKYLKDNPKIPKELAKAFKKMDSSDTCLQQNLPKGQGLDATARKNLVEVSQVLAKYNAQPIEFNGQCLQASASSGTWVAVNHSFCAAVTSKMTNDEKNFVLGALELRLTAIKDQLSMTIEDKRTTEMDALSNSLKQSGNQFGL